MEKNFEITKVVVIRKKNVQMVNYHWLPGYTELWYVNVFFTKDGNHYKRRYYTLRPECIDGSKNAYYNGMRDSIYEEIYMNETYDDMKNFIDREQKCFAEFFDGE